MDFNDGIDNLEFLTDQLKTFFSDDDRFTFQKRVGSGAFGFGLLFHENLSGERIKRFVVKRAFESDEQVENEAKYLELYKHAGHIVNLIKVHPNPLEPDDSGQGGLGAAYIIIEYLEGGTSDGLSYRARKATIPNRVLAYMLLCLARACVALAYPPDPPVVQTNQQEVIPVLRTPTKIAHWDINPGNVMFGSVNPSVSEHTHVPIMKLIDFGLTGERKFPERPSKHILAEFDTPLELHKYNQSGITNIAIQANIFDVGMIIVPCITGVSYDSMSSCRQKMRNMALFPELDPDLRLILTRCIAADPNNRPKLDELLRTAEKLVADKDDMWYTHAPGKTGEKDPEIRAFVQKYIYDAPVARPKSLSAAQASEFDAGDELSDD